MGGRFIRLIDLFVIAMFRAPSLVRNDTGIRISGSTLTVGQAPFGVSATLFVSQAL